MDSIQRVHDIGIWTDAFLVFYWLLFSDTDLSNFVENHAESFHMPCMLAEMSTRIDFLSTKLTESGLLEGSYFDACQIVHVKTYLSN